jgi:hypothetical protein
MHTMDFTIDMLRGFVAQGIRNFAFIDEMISPKHFTWLAEGLKEANLDISYYALTKPSRDFTPSILATMYESGCKYLLWGMESGCQRILDLMDKGSQVPEVAGVLQRARAAGIHNHVYMICGFPTETEEEYAQTIRFLDENKDYISAVHRGPFSLEPESPIFEEQKRFGITRSWMIKDTPGGGRWGYELESGMSMQKIREVFAASLPFLRCFNPHARYLANFRDHALLVYGRSKVRFESRKFPRVSYGNTSFDPNRQDSTGFFRLSANHSANGGGIEVVEDCKSAQAGVGASGNGAANQPVDEFFASLATPPSKFSVGSKEPK